MNNLSESRCEQWRGNRIRDHLCSDRNVPEMHIPLSLQEFSCWTYESHPFVLLLVEGLFNLTGWLERDSATTSYLFGLERMSSLTLLCLQVSRGFYLTDFYLEWSVRVLLGCTVLQCRACVWPTHLSIFTVPKGISSHVLYCISTSFGGR